AQPTTIEVKDGTHLVASVRPGRPCRASIGPLELIVGGPPIISQLGETRWSGETTPQGTVLSRNNDRVARVFPVDDPAKGGVYTNEGAAMIRVAAAGDKATVTDAASLLLRTLERAGTGPSV